MKTSILTSIALGCLLVSCGNGNENEINKTDESTIELQSNTEEQTLEKEPVVEFQNKGHELVYAMVNKVGDYNKMLDKKDVVYTYTYEKPDGKKDISIEKYTFGEQLSYGSYEQNGNTFPQLEGTIEQGFDGDEFWIKLDGKVLTDEKILKMVAFRRPTNFYWFAMLPKLLDPSVNYEHLGEKTIDAKEYDVVKTSFISPDNKPTDIYQLYINKETGLVDQFLFTVADFGKMDTPNLMKLEYEDVDGILLPTKRKYKKSTWDAAVENDDNWILATWSDIKFNNGLTKEDFKK